MSEIHYKPEIVIELDIMKNQAKPHFRTAILECGTPLSYTLIVIITPNVKTGRENRC